MSAPKTIETIVCLAAQTECTCSQYDLAAEYLRAYDQEVAKAASINEVIQIARAEVRARAHLLKKWEVRAAQAAATAGAIVGGGGTVKQAATAVDGVMRKWSRDVSKQYSKELKLVWRLGRQAGKKRVGGKLKSLAYSTQNFQEELVSVSKAPKAPKGTAELHSTFELSDVAAAQQLATQELVWIGETYEGVAPVVRTALAPKLLEGMSRAEAGAAVAKTVENNLKSWTIPGGWNGSASKYFEGLAANAVTNARVQSQLTSFAHLGVEQYQLVNPMDDRTTPICALLNGTVYTVSEGAEQLDAMRSAKTPEEYKAAAPWISYGSVASIFTSGGSSALAGAGVALPPFHFRCRTTIDIYG